MRNCITSILALLLCFSGRTEALAASPKASEIAGAVAKVRNSWLTAFKSKDVAAAVAFYTSDAAFLQPSGDRIQGIQAIRELYEKVVNIFDTDLVMTSRNLEASADLAYDSGEYEETLTNRATGQKQHYRGQYVIIFRRTSAGHFKISQHVWTVAPNPA